MKDKFKKIDQKTAFIEFIAGKLDLKNDSVRCYFDSGKIPSKHSEFINKALDIQLEYDQKIREIKVKAFDLIGGEL